MSGEDSGPVWIPSSKRRASASLREFARLAADLGAPISLEDINSAAYYRALHDWSIREPDIFWEAVWDFCDCIGDKGAYPFFVEGKTMQQGRFFPDARLNFAENLLRHGIGREEEIAVRFRDEERIDDGRDSFLSWGELRRQVAHTQKALIDAGIQKGDRVAAILPNMPASVVLALASASIGAIFSSCSPDYGARGILDRFSQIEPKILVACDSCRYNGKYFSQAEKLGQVLGELPGETRLWIQRATLGASAFDQAMQLPLAQSFDEILSTGDEPPPLSFERLPFDHPLYIVFSSGTTGAPKCMIHRAGGVLLQHLKEHRIHCDLRPGDSMCYFTTCSWMMWNWMISSLASGAQIQLFEGSPLYPGSAALFDYAADARTTHLGVSPKLLDVMRGDSLAPNKTHDLSALRCILSAGSPLLNDHFNYVYKHIKTDVHLASISGGTELISCFVLGNPDAPVHSGEIQCKGLGMAVEMWSPEGEPLEREKGELVCVRPFPTMPIGFWNDPDGDRYRAAYFEHFPGIWRHGDFAAFTENDGVVIFGRSDALLNIGGVRVGTAELYAIVERMDDIAEAIAVAQEWKGDARIVLFVRMKGNAVLDNALRERIRKAVARDLNPRFAPAIIIQVDDIPRTKSGKITELAVRDVIHNRQVKNRSALANPEALEAFASLKQLERE